MEVDSVVLAPIDPATSSSTAELVGLAPVPTSPGVVSTSSPAVPSASSAFTLSPAQLSTAYALFQKQYAYTVLQLEATTAEMHRVQAQLRTRKSQARRSTAALLNSGSGDSSSRTVAPGSGDVASHVNGTARYGAPELSPSERALLRAHRHSTDGPESLGELHAEASALISCEWTSLARMKRLTSKGNVNAWREVFEGDPGERMKELAASCIALMILIQRCADEGRVPSAEEFELLLRNLEPKHTTNKEVYTSICESTTAIYRELVRTHAVGANGTAAGH